MEKKKILVVEDETIVAHDLRESVKKLGYEVTALVASGEDAIIQAEKDQPDLVLMDVVLNGKVDGVQAAQKINSRLNIPIVFLTAYSDDKTQLRAKNSAPFGYVCRPTKFIRILAACANTAFQSSSVHQSGPSGKS